MKKLLLNTIFLLLAAAGASAEPAIDVTDYNAGRVHEKFFCKTLTENDFPFTFNGKFTESPAVYYYDRRNDRNDYSLFFKLEVSELIRLKVTAENASDFLIFKSSNGDSMEISENEYQIFEAGTYYGQFSNIVGGSLDNPYSVKIEEIPEFAFENGNQIKSDKDIVEVGEFVTLMPRPAKGYKFESVSVSYKGKNVCVNDDLTFIKPAGEFEVSATFTKTDEGGDENPNPDNGNEGGNQNPTDVEDVNVSAQSIVGEKFHTILGQPLSEPQTSGVMVVTRTYSDGSTSSSKEVR